MGPFGRRRGGSRRGTRSTCGATGRLRTLGDERRGIRSTRGATGPIAGPGHPGRASAGDPFYSWRHGADCGLSGVSAAGPVLRGTPRGGTCSTRGAKGPIVGGTRSTQGIQLSGGSRSRGIAVIPVGKRRGTRSTRGLQLSGGSKSHGIAVILGGKRRGTGSTQGALVPIAGTGRVLAREPFYAWHHGADRGLSGVGAAGPILP